ncbi:MAG: peptidase E [Candidatus Obscuribacterales bacterium]|nr:peptidase E [Candidatus Obscuribacterales bacterium]
MANKHHVPLDRRHIVAMGGGFTNPLVLDYVLTLSGKPNPKLLFINTATGDSADSLLRNYTKVAALKCTPAHLALFARTPPDLEALIFSQDVIFVGGGNTKSMLAVWREYGLDHILKEAWKRGIVLSGSSAGGICWFESCCTDSFAEAYTALPALGFLKGSCCPHYDGEPGRPETFHGLIEAGLLGDGYAVDEGVGLHFVNRKLVEVVTAKAGSTAYRVKRKGSKILDKPYSAKLLS